MNAVWMNNWSYFLIFSFSLLKFLVYNTVLHKLNNMQKKIFFRTNWWIEGLFTNIIISGWIYFTEDLMGNPFYWATNNYIPSELSRRNLTLSPSGHDTYSCWKGCRIGFSSSFFSSWSFFSSSSKGCKNNSSYTQWNSLEEKLMAENDER